MLGDKPNIADDSYNQYDDNLVSQLIDQISNLSSIYHKTPEELATQQRRQGLPYTPNVKKEEDKSPDEQQESAKPADDK